MEQIKKVVAITPVWNESLGMIQSFRAELDKVKVILNSRGIGFAHYFLDDAALNLPEEAPILVRHQKNEGLAKTLLDGYREVLELRVQPEIIIRLDGQEHDALKIIEIVDNMAESPIDAVFMPVYYWIKGVKRPLMKEVVSKITGFIENLTPINEQGILATYNQVFPLGYQAFRKETLLQLLPQLEQGAKLCEKITGKKATWGLDLLVILLAAHHQLTIDFIWGGWAKPWMENRGADKIAAQADKARVMIEVAAQLGAEVK